MRHDSDELAGALLDRINEMSPNELEHQIPLDRNSLEAATRSGGEGRIRTFGARPRKPRPTGC